MTNTFPTIKPRLGLYPVVDSVEWIERMLKLGVRTIQLRIKNITDQEVVKEIVCNAIKLGKQYSARLFINDYWRLAIRYNAYGVHLGQEDLDFADIESIRQAGLRLGVSTHDDAELDRGLKLRPSYIALGHIFTTQTKKMHSSPQGIAGLKRHLTRLQNVPTVAIGGISLAYVPEVLATGVGSIAVVSAITQAPDWRAATQQLLELVGTGT